MSAILGPDGRPARAYAPEAKSLSFSELLLLDANATSSPLGSRILSRESYARLSYAFRAVHLVATSASTIPFQAVREREVGVYEPLPREHYLNRLVRRPNRFTSGMRLFEAVVAFLKLNGNAYVLLGRAGQDRNGALIPGGSYVLRPDRVTLEESDRAGEVERIVYQPERGEAVTYRPDEVVIFRSFNPLSDVYGMSEVKPAEQAVEQLNSSNAWNTALLRNGGKPSALVIAKHALSPEQVTTLQEWKQSQYGGPANAGRIAVIEGSDIEWKELGMNARDLDYIEGRKMSAVEVALAFGVPPELLGISDAKTFSNYAEARTALYTETVIPLVEYVLDEINAHYAEVTGESDVMLRAEYERVEALSKDKGAEYKRVSEAFVAGWLTVNDARAEVEMPEEEDPARGNVYKWEQARASTPPALLGETDGDPTPPPPDEDPEDEAEEARTRREAGDAAPEDEDGGKGAGTPERKFYRLSTPEQKRAHAERLLRLREAAMPDVVDAALREFAAQSADVTAAARAASSLDDLRALPDVVKAHALEDALRESYVDMVETIARAAAPAFKGLPAPSRKDALEDAAARVVEAVLPPVADGATVTPEQVAASVAFVERAAREFVDRDLPRDVEMVTETTRRHVAETVTTTLATMADDASVAAAAVAVSVALDALFEGFGYRARTIADTETGTFQAQAVRTVARATGRVGSKRWENQADQEVRPSHVNAGGQTRGLDEDFVVGGHRARFPMDPNLPASERVNCRCFEVYS